MLDLLLLLAAAAGAAPTNGPALTLDEAVLMALRNNRELEVRRLEPALARTAEEVERAAFDPVLSAGAELRREAGADEPDESAVTVSAGQRLPTGTRLAAEAGGTRRPDEDPGPAAAGAAVTLTQALLQGRPLAANLASLRQARLDTALSEYELRGFAETLVAEVETEYWNNILARRRLAIVEESLRVADRQLREVDQRIRVGGLPETERASAQAESALRREALINARGALDLSTLRLRRLVDPAGLAAGTPAPVPATLPAPPPDDPDPPAVHVRAALLRRPDLNQARLLVDRSDLELVKTRNGLLPRLDLFLRLGDTGYARSFDQAARELDGNHPAYAAGLQFAFPPRNREARALHRRAGLEREQAETALLNLEDLVRVDVESAWIEAQRTREQIAATAVTRQFQEEKLRAEEAKFRVGRSTSLLVAQAQQDLVNSQVAEVLAVTAGLQARVRLYRLEGTLLERRGLAAPGAAPPPKPD